MRRLSFLLLPLLLTACETRSPTNPDPGPISLLVVSGDGQQGLVGEELPGPWIMSSAGAYAPDAGLAGKASFGFVAKYSKGASTPSGTTEFEFRAGNLAFQSTSYQWLVVAGARGQFKGDGTINGQAERYGFLLTAVDGQVSGGGGTDRFRLKIWDKTTNAVVYDNERGAAEDDDRATALGGGSIVIHQK